MSARAVYRSARDLSDIRVAGSGMPLVMTLAEAAGILGISRQTFVARYGDRSELFLGATPDASVKFPQSCRVLGAHLLALLGGGSPVTSLPVEEDPPTPL